MKQRIWRTETLELAGVEVVVQYKSIKHCYFRTGIDGPRLSVPKRTPRGAVRELAEFFVRSYQNKMREAAAKLVAETTLVPGDGNITCKSDTLARDPAPPCLFPAGDHCLLWGNYYFVKIVSSAHHRVTTENDELRISLPFQTDNTEALRERALITMDRWLREQLRQRVLQLLPKWQGIVKREIKTLQLRRMVSRWGSCTPAKARISINTELVKYPPKFLEYVVVHELVHLHHSGHGQQFKARMDSLLPNWRELQRDLNLIALASR